MIKTLLKSVREYRKQTVLAVLLILVEVMMDIVMPLVTARLVDYGVEPGNFPYVVKMGIVLILLSLVALIGGAGAAIFSARASVGFGANLRHDVFFKIQKFGFRNIDKFSDASLVTRLTSDITRVQNAYMMIIRNAIRTPAMLIFSILTVVRISRKLSKVFIFAVPFVLLGIVIVTMLSFPRFKSLIKRNDNLNSVVQEDLRGMRVVKAYVRENHEINNFTDVTQAVRKDAVAAFSVMAIGGPFFNLVSYACIIAISWIGAHQIVDSELTTGQLMIMINYTTMILFTLIMLAMIFMNLITSKASGDRIVEVLNEVPDMENGSCTDSPADGSVVFENVDFSYYESDGTDRPIALKGINLDIPSGSVVGIIGPTGSSKTTLVSLIPRLYDVTSGSIKVGGKDVREYDIKTLRDSVSVVLQKNTLFTGTVRSNLAWGNADATEDQMQSAMDIAHASEFVNALPEGLDAKVEQGGNNFSGGQKQRLCIARALLKNPKILILDDSTSAVDMRTDADIRASFKLLMPETTKFIISQRIASVKDSDIIIVMDNGHVSAVGTHEELLKQGGIYAEIAASQEKNQDFDKEGANA